MNKNAKDSKRGNAKEFRPDFLPPARRLDLRGRYVYDVDGHRKLGCAIIYQAVTDWRLLIKQKAWLKEYPDAKNNFGELRVFFKSGLCLALTPDESTLTPRRMLEILEEELAEAMKKEGAK